MNLGTSVCVTSKYFADEIPMDESLADFQEPKKSCKAVKAPQKASKPKPKKPSKQIKGQKDIRTVVNAKKNELLKYSKDFDNVCKQSGVDVDSEQLQLAIALSKSLQTEESSGSQSTQPLSSQERLVKIKTTLKEYGFKIPETKRPQNKFKKTKQHYKLLNTSEEEKRQNITAKYSQVLLQNIEHSFIDNNINDLDCQKQVFLVATSLSYEYMRDNKVFYTDIIEKSTTNGSMLRDWAEIPGRPVSPTLVEGDIMNISEIPCSQDDLDVILSGSIKAAKNIINTKKKSNTNDIVINLVDKENIDNVITTKQDRTIESKDIEVINLLAVSHQYRSSSPDLFDDEPSCIIETIKPANTLSQEQKTKVIDNDFMDLTECANNINPAKGSQYSQSGKSQNSGGLQLSQNITRRKSNDFMEITECVVRLTEGTNDLKEIDLTQSPEQKANQITLNEEPSANTIAVEQNNLVVDENIVVTNLKSDLNYKIDLTQSSNEENRITVIEEQKKDKINECMDLTQSSNSSEDINDLPEIILSNTCKSLDDTVILNEDEYLGANGQIKTSILPNNLTQEVLDLTQSENPRDHETPNQCSDRSTINEKSFFDDFVHNHSNSSEQLEENDIEISKQQKNDDDKSVANDIDLTQSSDTSEKSIIFYDAVKNIPNNSSLGRKDDLSIDYDEISDDITEPTVKETCKLNDSQNEEPNNVNIDYSSKNTSISQVYDLEIPHSSQNNDVLDALYDQVIDVNNDFASISQNSEVFDISDRELNYSLHQSRLEMPENHELDYSLEKSSKSLSEENLTNDNRNTTLEDSFPVVNIKNTDKTINLEESNSNILSPISLNHVKSKLPVKTPENHEYIVKTSDVTPILDYAAMSTPQRNHELDKYGLKPFKRKRAIQILTHLYNQTHPLVQKLDDDQPSPKKRKQALTSPGCTPTKSNQNELSNLLETNQSPSKRSETPKKSSQSKSPRKCVNKMATSKSPRKEYLCSYVITSELPVIRNLDCCSEDWVFQKREKAKVHSCRLPLHIAFHNYVSSRRSLREAILKYEPVNIDVIHKDLVGYGHRYDPKDLLKFLDKKCITVKTTDNNSRNTKR